ncbi:class III lanthionine synthetase LanKC [Crossiella sp. CA-258035]|uniref:class III lanthionine synthetase LanKC n=1 Tax=Crossiella sp. CA-258035 TaxID=2981138 RepID=UPI0024BCE0F9|nr:class III lanthionine synthetase LanKC [Crossiella sp. CA-258035]WHT18323.1 class III lanthionine synthetase LanKC [Crossiella sp. CA-258035]
MIEVEYEKYCFVDRYFYDSPAHRTAAVERYPLVSAPLPPQWRRSRRESWVMLHPRGVATPEQGWKIHVSATPDGAAEVLAAVAEDCLLHRVPFKFLDSRAAVLAHNAKYAARGSSGKFITLYPADETQLTRQLRRLGPRLAGRPGPYILNDLRFGEGPLYVRYGAFTERYCQSARGELVPALADPEGNLVPDERGPRFSPPDWVAIPEVLRPHLARRRARAALPYRVLRPLHFSNAGGVYLAEEPETGRTVVLKEARPHAGLDTDGHDAVHRLANEHDMLTLLAGAPGVPEVLGRFRCWEHEFLALSHVEGVPLATELVRRYPLAGAAADEAEVAGYTRWALEVVEKVTAAMAALHERGVVFGDLHPNNVMVGPDGRVTLLDFELAAPVGAATRPPLGAPGYTAPPGVGGFDVDHYALAALRLALFLPLNSLCALAPGKVRSLCAAVLARFPVPPEYVRPILDRLCAGSVPPPVADAEAVPPMFPTGPADLDRLREQITAAILASATPQRSDRLFPGDIAQFAEDGLGLAHGAAGVLHALHTSGCGRFPEFEDWLLRALIRRGAGRPGLFAGRHGIALVLAEFGHTGTALELIERAAASTEACAGADLYEGLSGIGLTLLHLGRTVGRSWLTEWGLDLADRVAGRVLAGVEAVPFGLPGLSRGGAGAALFLSHAHAEGGPDRLLDAAGTALHRDLQHAELTAAGALHVRAGRKLLPYLAAGTAGIAIAMAELLRRRPDPVFLGALPSVRRALEAEFTVHSGLFTGRAGLVCALAALRGLPEVDAGQLDAALHRHVSRLAWHAVPHGGGLAFPGDALLRLSHDLATGSAGVLLALHTVATGALPLFGRVREGR